MRLSIMGSFVAASMVACAGDPVATEVKPQLSVAADSVALNLFTTGLVNAAVFDTPELPHYESRDANVATVTTTGTITGVGVGSTYVVASLTSFPSVRDSLRVRVYSDSCGGARPDFGIATAADLNLYRYDVNAPLNLQKTLESTVGGVEVSAISYNSPDGGQVTGVMWDPVTRSSARPGIVLMHGHPSKARDLFMMSVGQAYAGYGAVVISIDAPFARRTGGAMMLLPQDATEQVQVIKDLQRAVDVLRSRPNVDDARIAFVGFSWGGATGALFAGIEHRIKAAALVVGHPGQVSHATGVGGFKNIASLPCARRVAWIRAMTPTEPIRYVGRATMPLLLQNGTFDEFIPAYEAAELHVAAPNPKTVLWYSTGHNLNQQAVIDRHNWLVQQVGIDPR